MAHARVCSTASFGFEKYFQQKEIVNIVEIKMKIQGWFSMEKKKLNLKDGVKLTFC